MDEFRNQLHEAQDQVRALREERNRLRGILQSAKSAAFAHDSDQTVGTVSSAKEAIDQVEQKLEAAEARQVSLLQRLADSEAGVPGFSMRGGSGWDQASAKLSLSGDAPRLRIDMAGGTLLRAAVGPLPPSPRDGSAGIAGGNAPSVPNTSPRYLYPALVQSPLGLGETTTTDFTVDFSGPGLTGVVSGVERDVDATTPKAELSPTVALANPVARMFACVLDAVPSRVFDSQQALRALLSVQLARQLDLAIDEHVVTAIEGGSPPSDSSGSDLISKIRNAVSAHRDYGSNPTLIALTPADAASLDLSTDGPSPGSYIFSPDRTGSGVPIWSLQVREVTGIAHPTLIDPARWGVLFVGGGSILVDPYGANMKANLVSVRVEVEGVAHRRDPIGAYVIN